jgi:DNA-binding SARP family transcriptional activator
MTPPDTDTAGEPPVVAIRLLDGFRLAVDDNAVPVIPSSQRLLAYLALHETPVPRATLAAALWPDIPEKRGAARLRSALWRLVKPPHALVVADQALLSLSRQIDVDVVAIRRFASELAAPGVSPAAPPASLSADLLPGWTDSWVVAERDWFRQLCLRTLEMLSEHLRTHGDVFQAHEAAAAAVRRDPLRESAHRRLIEVHLADGNPAAALHQYATYRTRLHEELGLAPSNEIRALLHPLLAQDEVRRHSMA